MLTIVLLDVILLVFLLMMSVPLPYCFGGALAFYGHIWWRINEEYDVMGI